MTIGASIFLIAVGAILKFAVTYTFAGIDIHVVGVILMIAGGVGLLLGLFFMAQGSRRTAQRTEVYYDNQNPPPPPPPQPPATY